eukprot:m.261007 g.261007  ORF g.261007 m.261007 type:complete len:100 (+) comp19684_c0_seq6:302-601(+)
MCFFPRATGDDTPVLADGTRGIHFVFEQQTKPNLDDPIRWFGLFTPPALKKSQSCFKQVVGKAAEIATIRARMHDCRCEYKELLRKRRSDSQANDSGGD